MFDVFYKSFLDIHRSIEGFPSRTEGSPRPAHPPRVLHWPGILYRPTYFWEVLLAEELKVELTGIAVGPGQRRQGRKGRVTGQLAAQAVHRGHWLNPAINSCPNYVNFYFASGIGFSLYPVYFITKWSCSASRSLWKMSDLNPGPLVHY